MATLFDVGVPAINKHLNNLYLEGEILRETTVSKMEIVQLEGQREVKRLTELYNLDAIISVGYRVNSLRATQFRQWCTYVLRQFTIRGYVIDKKRMGSGWGCFAFLSLWFVIVLSTFRFRLLCH